MKTRRNLARNNTKFQDKRSVLATTETLQRVTFHEQTGTLEQSCQIYSWAERYLTLLLILLLSKLRGRIRHPRRMDWFGIYHIYTSSNMCWTVQCRSLPTSPGFLPCRDELTLYYQNVKLMKVIQTSLPHLFGSWQPNPDDWSIEFRQRLHQNGSYF